MLRFNNTVIKAIWFNATDNSSANYIKYGDNIRVCYQLQREEYMGRVSLTINVEAVELEKS